jgi:hypothetical protein
VGLEFGGDRRRQSIGGPAHEHAIGQRCQQRRLGRANLLGGVVVPHSSEGYASPAARVDWCVRFGRE